MKKSSLLIAAAALALTAFGAQAATPAAPAPAPAAAPATPPAPPPAPTFTATIPGQCVLDPTAVLANSKLGQAATARLQQLDAVVKSEMTTKSATLQTDYDATQAAIKAAQAPGATAAVKQTADTKQKAFNDELSSVQSLDQQRRQELQYTQNQVQQWLVVQMIPSVNAVVATRGCAVVTNADSLLHYYVPDTTSGQPNSLTDMPYANPSMNITNDVVAKFDAANITLPEIQRANLDQQADAGGQ